MLKAYDGKWLWNKDTFVGKLLLMLPKRFTFCEPARVGQNYVDYFKFYWKWR